MNRCYYLHRLVLCFNLRVHVVSELEILHCNIRKLKTFWRFTAQPNLYLFKYSQPRKKQRKSERGDEESIPVRHEAKDNYSSSGCSSSVTSLNESGVSMRLQV